MNTILRISFFLLLSMLPSVSFGAEDSWKNAWQKGLGALEYGDFEAAVSSFEKVIADGHESASAYHNLSLAYAGEGSPGLSELARQRALALKPDLYAETFREKIRFSSGTLALFTMVLFWTLVFLLLFAFFSEKRSLVRKLSIAFFSVFFVACLFVLWGKRTDFDKAVVVAIGKYLKNSPTEYSSDATAISAGEQVWILQHQGNWLKIKTDSNASGWISLNDCIPVWRME